MTTKMKIVIAVGAIACLIPVVMIGKAMYDTSSTNSKMDQLAMRQAQLEKRNKTLGPVAVAEKNLTPGALISKGDVGEKQVDLGTVPLETISTAASLVGKRTRCVIKKGQTFMPDDVMEDRLHAQPK